MFNWQRYKKYLDGSVLVLLLSAVLFSWTYFSADTPAQNDFHPSVQWTVSEGESVWSIARHASEEMDMSIEEAVAWIKSENSLDSSSIYPGQNLSVPADMKGVASE